MVWLKKYKERQKKMGWELNGRENEWTCIIFQKQKNNGRLFQFLVGVVILGVYT